MDKIEILHLYLTGFSDAVESVLTAIEAITEVCDEDEKNECNCKEQAKEILKRVEKVLKETICNNEKEEK